MILRRRLHGFTLIELVISIVVLAIGATALLVLINQTTANSVDPIIHQQAHAVAQSYLEEVLLNPFCDPDLSTNCPVFCDAAAVAGAPTICTVCSENTGGFETRSTFDDVCDYDTINDTGGAVDQTGNPIAPAILGAYNINVSIVDTGFLLNGLDSDTGQVVRIDVIVTHDDIATLNLTLSSYKANF